MSQPSTVEYWLYRHGKPYRSFPSAAQRRHFLREYFKFLPFKTRRLYTLKTIMRVDFTSPNIR